MDYEVIVPDEIENDFNKFIKKLDKNCKSRVEKEIDLLEKHGINLSMPYSKKVDSSIWELRTTGQQKVRILYCFNREKIFLLNWFIKKSKKLPMQELDKANKRLHLSYH